MARWGRPSFFWGGEERKFAPTRPVIRGLKDKFGGGRKCDGREAGRPSIQRPRIAPENPCWRAENFQRRPPQVEPADGGASQSAQRRQPRMALRTMGTSVLRPGEYHRVASARQQNTAGFCRRQAGVVRVRSCSGSSGSESPLRSAARAISWQEIEETPTRSAVSIRSRQDSGNLWKSQLMNHSQIWVSNTITSGIPNPLRQRRGLRCLRVS
mgnify:CR=1 FL=1